MFAPKAWGAKPGEMWGGFAPGPPKIGETTKKKIGKTKISQRRYVEGDALPQGVDACYRFLAKTVARIRKESTTYRRAPISTNLRPTIGRPNIVGADGSPLLFSRFSHVKCFEGFLSLTCSQPEGCKKPRSSHPRRIGKFDVL